MSKDILLKTNSYISTHPQISFNIVIEEILRDSTKSEILNIGENDFILLFHKTTLTKLKELMELSMKKKHTVLYNTREDLIYAWMDEYLYCKISKNNIITQDNIFYIFEHFIGHTQKNIIILPYYKSLLIKDIYKIFNYEK